MKDEECMVAGTDVSPEELRLNFINEYRRTGGSFKEYVRFYFHSFDVSVCINVFFRKHIPRKYPKS